MFPHLLKLSFPASESFCGFFGLLIKVNPVWLYACLTVKYAEIAQVVLRLAAEELEGHVVVHGTGQSDLSRLETLRTAVRSNGFKQRLRRLRRLHAGSLFCHHHGHWLLGWKLRSHEVVHVAEERLVWRKAG